jgi:hypothetical protein
MILDDALAQRMAGIALGHVTRPYPYALLHVMAGPGDMVEPRVQHPIFHGSFDWHSCVHGWWLLMRLARLFPATAAPTLALADASFTPEKVAGECAYFQRPTARGFERPYGWGWLLALHGEIAGTPHGETLAPLARLIAARLTDHLPALTYPIRTGAHGNTAFALILAQRWAQAHDPALAALIAARARGWFGADRGAQAWEPDGDAFLSPTLCEALLMAQLLPAAAFAAWFDGFLPEAAAQLPASLFQPASVSDRSDGKIAHLDGFNLSRAWCWRGIAAALPAGHPARAGIIATADALLAAGLPHIAGDYAGEHWLASFALLALAD